MKRSVHSTFRTKEFLEGAGVRLHRGFSYMPENIFDPFLLFDDFSSENPIDYLAGFPWHPHRGIETVTYILKGDVEHKDSIGNEGIISKGDIQWMSAGSGIIHQEMPKGARGLTGFQLWINIPASKKMDSPGYQEHIAKEIPEFEYSKGVVARLISGVLGENVGPIARDTVDPTYIDFLLKPSTTLQMNLTDGYTTFIYIFEGRIHIGSEQYDAGSVVLLHKKGTMLSVESSSSGARILVVSGRALHEPVAWHGPIVMNTKEQLVEAFTDLQNGTFIK